jgi:hypothetical protein
VQSLVSFLKAKNFRLVEIHMQIFELYDEGAMDGRDVRKWSQFSKKKKKSMTDMHGDEESGRLLWLRMIWGGKKN